VNFFGHATVAAWYHAAPALAGAALGAMLPDLATMIGARLPKPSDGDVAAGMALHHRTDAAFHVLPEFVALQRELDRRLAAAGCGRGPARATAHVGVELLLDGILVTDGAARSAYLAALAHPGTALGWHEPDDGARFAAVQDRMRAHGVPDDLRRPEGVTARLLRAIAHRPLLRASPADAAIIGRELAAFSPRVAVVAPALMSALRAVLDGRPPGSATSGEDAA